MVRGGASVLAGSDHTSAISFWRAVLALLLIALIAFVTRTNYALLNVAAEGLALVAAVLAGVLALTTFRLSRDNVLLFVGTAYLFVAVTDFFHMITLRGMGVLTGVGPDAPLQFWLVGRYLEAGALLAAPLALRHRVPWVVELLVVGVVTTALSSLILGWRAFPQSLLADGRFTTFYNASEQLLAVLFSAAALNFYIQFRRAGAPVSYGLTAAAGLAASADLIAAVYGRASTGAAVYRHLLEGASHMAVFFGILSRGLEVPVALVASELAAEATARAALEGHLMEVQEAERRRISQELHDDVGQALTRLVAGLSSMAESGCSQDARLIRMKQLSVETLGSVRRLARELRPAALDDMGLAAALSHYLDDYGTTYGIPCDLRVLGAADRRLRESVELALYRVAQEALTNAAKHSRASCVRVVLDLAGSSAGLVVQDDGRGFDPALDHGGLGLTGMRERVTLVGGTLAVRSSPGLGTVIIVTVPVSEGGDCDASPSC